MIKEYIKAHHVKDYEEAGWNVVPVGGNPNRPTRYLAVRSEPEIERGRIAPETQDERDQFSAEFFT